MHKIISCLLGITLSTSVLSDNTTPTNNTPWNQHIGNFTEINVGANAYYWGFISSNSNSTGAGIYGEGWSAAFGRNFTRNFGLEAGFMQNYAPLNDGNSGHSNIPYVTTRFTVPIYDRFSFIGKLGLMYPMGSDSTDGFLLPYTGIGGAYALTQNLDFTVQYQGAVYGIASAGLLSMGITYHF